MDQVFDGLLDEDRLVKKQAGDQLLGHIHQMSDAVAHTIHHGDGVGIATLFEHRQVGGALAVNADHVGLDLRPVLRLADITHKNRGQPHRLERDALDLLHGVDLAVRVQIVVHRADSHITRRQNQVRFVDRTHYIHNADLMSLQLQGIHIDHDLAVLAAERGGHGSAGDPGHLIADDVVANVAQLRFAHAFALQRNEADRQAGGVKL